MCGTTKEEESVSMFWFMECACQVLSEVSQNLNNRASVQSQSQGPATNVRPVHPNFCYTRMMWCKYNDHVCECMQGSIYMLSCNTYAIFANI